VRGTVRDKNNEKKVAPIRKAFGENFSKLEFVEADLLKPETLDAAIAGQDFVVHTASPFVLEAPKDENDLIRPAVEGTLAVVRAAHKHKVKRVVITSSVVSIMVQKEENIKTSYTEQDWSDTTIAGAYEKSKTLAERAAWDFLNKLPESERFELVIINPGLILGPTLIPGDFASASFITQVLNGSLPGIPRVKLAIVDVRECALAHLTGLKTPEAAGKRFILASRTVWFGEIAQALAKQYPENNIKTGELPYCPVKFLSFFSKQVKNLIPLWGKDINFDNKQSRDILKVEYRHTDESIVAMAEALYDFGQLQRKKAKN
jgi:nucleoside-diphosphate-sugar epimerase